MKKILVMGLALAGMAATAPLNAQIIARNPASSSSASGSWHSIGRDANGYSIYERRTRDRNGNIVIQRARRNSNGSMSVISTRTVRDDSRRSGNCNYTRSTNSVGDIIFGRTSNEICDDDFSREDGGWYQVGRGPNNNSIYERRVRDRNGNLVIQRARRNSNGSLTIISTRRANDNDRQWKRDRRDDRRDARRDRRDDRRDRRDDRRDRDTDRDTDRKGRGW